MFTRLKPAAPLLAAALVVAAAACSDDDGGPTTPKPPRFEIVPEQPSLSLTQDDSIQVGTTLYDRANGTIVSHTGMTLTSADPAVVVVRNSGSAIVKALTGGSTKLTFSYTDPASKQSATAEIPVTVTAVPVGSVVFKTADTTVFRTADTARTIFADQKVKLTAVAKDAAGKDRPLRLITYSIPTADAGIAGVGADGTVTPKDAGTVHVIATAEGKADTVVVPIANRVVTRVTVAPALSTVKVGGTVKLTAAVTGTDKSGNDVTITNRIPTWTSSDPSLVSISGGTLGSTATVAVVKGESAPAGGALVTITATVDGVSGSAQIVVNP